MPREQCFFRVQRPAATFILLTDIYRPKPKIPEEEKRWTLLAAQRNQCDFFGV